MASDSGAKPYVTSFQGKAQISSSDFLKIFKSFDKDGNGYIEAGELDEFLKTLGKESNKEELDPQEIAKMKKEILSKYDVNYDGRLDLEELTKILPTEENFLVQFQHHVNLTSVEFFKVWNHYDQDNSGYIESDELRGFLADLHSREGKKLTPDWIDENAIVMLDLFDKNKDGKLSLSEMSKILPLEENFLAQFKEKLTEEEFNQIWTKYDEDGNGFIADEEIDALMHDFIITKLKREVDSKEVANFRSSIMGGCQVDIDRDGKINKEELKRFLLGQK
ncbi:calretinin-like isoform X2 [Montipora capricornis]|uniref:calretinin-like isoform X2 n=1 Tax=Montipora capricornis TaxID=246305 RepID=UPI0035F1FB6F